MARQKGIFTNWNCLKGEEKAGFSRSACCTWTMWKALVQSRAVKILLPDNRNKLLAILGNGNSSFLVTAFSFRYSTGHLISLLFFLGTGTSRKDQGESTSSITCCAFYPSICFFKGSSIIGLRGFCFILMGVVTGSTHSFHFNTYINHTSNSH